LGNYLQNRAQLGISKLSHFWADIPVIELGSVVIACFTISNLRPTFAGRKVFCKYLSGTMIISCELLFSGKVFSFAESQFDIVGRARIN
jgi:hypothetical protein